MKDSLTIGIPVCEGEMRIANMFASLFSAVKNSNVSVEILICHNGVKGDVWRFLSDIEKNHSHIRLFHNYELGKIKAQRTILKNRTLTGYVCFCDADIILDASCIKNLFSCLDDELKNNVHLVYACTKPELDLGNRLHRIQAVHYGLQGRVLVQRKYFHGRCFMFNPEYIEPLFFNEGLQCSRDYSDLYDGPRVDDVFLSRCIAHMFSAESMRICHTAIVTFIPPSSHKDFYRGQFRLWYEIDRLDRLFPEHKYLQEDVFTRRLRHHNQDGVTIRERVSYLRYHCYQSIHQIVIRKGVLLIMKLLGSEPKRHWQVLTTTKSYSNEKS